MLGHLFTQKEVRVLALLRIHVFGLQIVLQLERIEHEKSNERKLFEAKWARWDRDMTTFFLQKKPLSKHWVSANFLQLSSSSSALAEKAAEQHRWQDVFHELENWRGAAGTSVYVIGTQTLATSCVAFCRFAPRSAQTTRATSARRYRRLRCQCH